MCESECVTVCVCAETHDIPRKCQNIALLLLLGDPRECFGMATEREGLCRDKDCEREKERNIERVKGTRKEGEKEGKRERSGSQLM